MDEKKIELLLEGMSHKIRKKQYIKRFIVLAPFVALLLGLMFYQGYIRDLNEKVANEHIILEYTKLAMVNEVGRLTNDVNYIKNFGTTEDFVENKDVVTKKTLSKRLLAFAQDREVYDQIRILNMEGFEVIRINISTNGEFTIVSDHELQDKSDQYYFRKIIEMESDFTYISELDLNIEFGEIQVPYKPMLRGGTILVNEEGVPQYVLVLNYIGDRLLEKVIEDFAETTNSNVWLVNDRGEYLKHNDPEKEWGVIGHNTLTLKNEFPDLYLAMLDSDNGEVTIDSFIYTFNKISSSDYARELSIHEHLNVNWFLIGVVSRKFFDYIDPAAVGIGVLIGYALLILILSLDHRRKIARDYNHKISNLLSIGIEDSPSIVMLTDEDGSIKYVNKKFEEVTHFTLKEIINENPNILKSGEMSGEFYRQMWNNLKRDGFWRGEIHNKNKLGESYWTQTQITQINDKVSGTSHYLSLQENITDKKMLEHNINQLEHVDHLANIYNRRYFSKMIENEDDKYARFGRHFTVLMLDIDFFKDINHTFGHKVGDQVLLKCSELTNSLLREVDLQFRYNGDEFMIILPETVIEAGVIVANRIRSIVENYDFAVDNNKLKMTLSIGCAQNREVQSLDEVVNYAEKALELAKINGRNRVES